MHAVLRVDLETLAAIFLSDYFVDACRAITLGRFVIQRQVAGDRNGRVGQLQVAGLLFFMVGAGQEHRAELVEAELAVGLGVLDLLRVCGQLQAGIVRLGVAQREGQLAGEPVLVDVVERSTQQRAELVHGRAEVAAGEQFFMQPAGLEGADIAV